MEAENSSTLGCHVNCGLDSQFVVGCVTVTSRGSPLADVVRCGRAKLDVIGRGRSAGWLLVHELYGDNSVAG